MTPAVPAPPSLEDPRWPPSADKAVWETGERKGFPASWARTHQSDPVSAAESLVELICIIWLNIYRANLIFWAVSTADSWEGCNYGITGAQGSRRERTPRRSFQTNAARGSPRRGYPTSLQLGLCLGRICKPAPPRPSRQPQRRGPRRQQLLLFVKLILRADRGWGLGAGPELESLRGISHLILTAALGGNESVRTVLGHRSDNRRLC